MAKRTAFKNDQFRKNRGGHSQWLWLACEKCGAHVTIYQKDGPGILKRLYLDRMRPEAQVPRRGNLTCNRCGVVLGVRGVYKKEERSAFRLFAGALEKRLFKSGELDILLKSFATKT